jgi:hypothetical protein
MTSVHGAPQQGGALPAVIWHDYMSAVTEGHPCAPLHESSTGISFQPFYGKFAATGLAAAAAENEKSEPGKPSHHKAKPQPAPHAPGGPGKEPQGPGKTGGLEPGKAP